MSHICIPTRIKCKPTKVGDGGFPDQQTIFRKHKEKKNSSRFTSEIILGAPNLHRSSI